MSLEGAVAVSLVVRWLLEIVFRLLLSLFSLLGLFYHLFLEGTGAFVSALQRRGHFLREGECTDGPVQFAFSLSPVSLFPVVDFRELTEA